MYSRTVLTFYLPQHMQQFFVYNWNRLQHFVKEIGPFTQMQKPGLSVLIYKKYVHQNKSSNFDYLLSDSLQKAHQYSQTVEKGFYYYFFVCVNQKPRLLLFKSFHNITINVCGIGELSQWPFPTFTLSVRVIKITTPNHLKMTVLRKARYIYRRSGALLGYNFEMEHCQLF